MYEFKIVRRAIKGDDERYVATNSRRVAEYVRKHLLKKEQMWRECCWALFTDKSNTILGHFLVSVGGRESCAIDATAIGVAALGAFADGVILVHNHPSGNPTPGPADIRQTDALRNVLHALGISLLDHLVMADDCFFSFTDDRINRG
jgi:DNA repair protein RadC